MGNVNSLPIVSQVKSLVQAISGDAAGAKKTQEDFLETGVIVSQVYSAGLAINGDAEKAKKVQERFGTEALNTIDGIPVLGHIKSGIHYALGDSEAGKRSFNSATRSTLQIGAAAGGFAIGGPPGAVGASVATGAAYDAGLSGYDALVNNKKFSDGQGLAATIARKFDKDAPKVTSGEAFDVAFGTAMDAYAGKTMGRPGNTIKAAWRRPEFRAATRLTELETHTLERLRASAFAEAEFMSKLNVGAGVAPEAALQQIRDLIVRVEMDLEETLPKGETSRVPKTIRNTVATSIKSADGMVGVGYSNALRRLFINRAKRLTDEATRALLAAADMLSPAEKRVVESMGLTIEDIKKAYKAKRGNLEKVASELTKELKVGEAPMERVFLKKLEPFGLGELKSVIDRRPLLTNCAEPHAFLNLVDLDPTGAPQVTSTVSIRILSEKEYALVQRCENCQQVTCVYGEIISDGPANELRVPGEYDKSELTRLSTKESEAEAAARAAAEDEASFDKLMETRRRQLLSDFVYMIRVYATAADVKGHNN